ncbi:MAG: DedA family protein [Cyanobacteria bacterium]|nr:DedA family protein [Cyanobacteriota bacterium]MDW8200677.1 DedA family protein [Cyanobacteriota bacterium SKYGB_h_bin112]
MSFDLISVETLQGLAHQYGYIAVFLGILLENMGIPLPGETITLAGGFLAGSGELSYWLTLVSAIVGAVVGDNVGYWLGSIGGWGLLVRIGRFFRIPEQQLIQVKTQFSDNADRAVLLGRFVALLRIFAGPLAGMVQMPYMRFVLLNAIGATLWAVTMVTLAYTVGRIVPLATLVAWVGQFALLTLLGIIAWIAIPRYLDFRKQPSDS